MFYAWSSVGGLTACVRKSDPLHYIVNQALLTTLHLLQRHIVTDAT